MLNYSDWIGGKLAAPVTIGQTTNIQLVTGALNDAPAAPFIAVLHESLTDSNNFLSARECVLITSYTDDLILTCTRGYESSIGGGAARAWTTNDYCSNIPTAGWFNNLNHETVSQAEAEAGIATTIRNWTAQRVRQAINACFPVTINSHGTAWYLPNGYIVQFGSSTFAISTGEAAGGDYNQTLPVSFPNNCLFVGATYKRIGIISGSVGCYADIIDNSTINVTVDPSTVAEPSPATVYWLAIGK